VVLLFRLDEQRSLSLLMVAQESPVMIVAQKNQRTQKLSSI